VTELSDQKTRRGGETNRVRGGEHQPQGVKYTYESKGGGGREKEGRRVHLGLEKEQKGGHWGKQKTGRQTRDNC